MTAGILDSASADAGERPWRLALRRLARRRAALVGLAVVVFFIAVAARCTARRTLRPARHRLASGAQAAFRLASFRHRRTRPRRPRAAHLGSPSVADGRPRLGVDRGRRRGAARARLRLSRRRRRWSADAHDRRDVGDPVPDPGDRPRRLSRAEPDERDDRDRGCADADFHPPYPRAGAGCQARGLHRGGPRGRQLASPYRAAPHPAQCAGADPSPGDARDRGSDHRRGEPSRFSVSASSRRRRAGAACSTPPATFSHRRRGWRCGRAWRSSAWCCRSTCSATGCATRSIRAGVNIVFARLWDSVLFWRRAAGVLATLSLALLVAAIIAREPPDFSAMPVVAIVRDGEQHPVWAIRLARAAHQIAADSLRPQPVAGGPCLPALAPGIRCHNATSYRPIAPIGAQGDRGDTGECAPVGGRRRTRGHARTNRRLTLTGAERAYTVPGKP